MKESEIDSNRFGFKVAKTDGIKLRNSTYHEIKESGFKLIIARVDLNDIDLINKMEDIGFKIKDIQTTYKHNLDNINFTSSFSNQPSLIIREFNLSDTDALVNLAKSSFNNYGHYFKNEKLNKRKCLEIYEDWAYNTCTNSDFSDKILVACDNDVVIGYLSFKIHNKFSIKKYAAGGMGAVDSKYRGMNIFSEILKAGLVWSSNQNLNWCEHNVLINNISVNKSMINAGFKPNKPVVTMHLNIE